jgi:hypothetical protein
VTVPLPAASMLAPCVLPGGLPSIHQELLDDAFGLVVFAFAEMVVTDAPLRVDEIMRGPAGHTASHPSITITPGVLNVRRRVQNSISSCSAARHFGRCKPSRR